MAQALSREKASSARVVALELESLVNSWEMRWHSPLNFESHDEFLYKRRFYVRQLTALAKRANALFLYQASRSIGYKIAEVEREIAETTENLEANPDEKRKVVLLHEEALEILTLHSVAPPTSLHFEPTRELNRKVRARPETAPSVVLPPIVRDRSADGENLTMDEKLAELSKKYTVAMGNGDVEASLGYAEKMVEINPLYVEGLRFYAAALQAGGMDVRANEEFLKADRISLAEQLAAMRGSPRNAPRNSPRNGVRGGSARGGSARSARRPLPLGDRRGGNGADRSGDADDRRRSGMSDLESTPARPSSALRRPGSRPRPGSAKSVRFPPPGEESRPNSRGSLPPSRPTSHGSVGARGSRDGGLRGASRRSGSGGGGAFGDGIGPIESSALVTVTTKRAPPDPALYAVPGALAEHSLWTYRGTVVPGALPLCDHRVCCARTRHPRRVAAWATRVCHDCEGPDDGDPRRFESGALPATSAFYPSPSKVALLAVRVAAERGSTAHVAGLFYCDVCYAEMHPWVRTAHNWTPTKPHAQPVEWKRYAIASGLHVEIERMKQEQIEVHNAREVADAVLESTVLPDDIGATRAVGDTPSATFYRHVRGTVTNVHETRARIKVSRVQLNEELQPFLDASLRFSKHTASKEMQKLVRGFLVQKKFAQNAAMQRARERNLLRDNAMKLQSCYRLRKSRQRMREMAVVVYEKEVDAESGLAFYYNKHTGQSSWVKPRALGDEEAPLVGAAATPLALADKKKKKREARVFTSDEEAASALQSMYRTMRARRRIQMMALGAFEKVYDEESDTCFYFNKKTGQSTWAKPKALGSADAVLVDDDGEGEDEGAAAVDGGGDGRAAGGEAGAEESVALAEGASAPGSSGGAEASVGEKE
jgi:hypothetical protein